MSAAPVTPCAQASQRCAFSGEVVFNWPSDDHPLHGSKEEPSGLFLSLGLNLGYQILLFFFFLCPELSKLGNAVNFSGARLKGAMIQGDSPTHFS